MTSYENDFQDWCTMGLDQSVHGTLWEIYKAQKTPIEVLDAFNINNSFYDSVFYTKKLDFNPTSMLLEIGLTPNARTLSNMGDKTPCYLMRYKREMLKRLPTCFGMESARVETIYKTKAEYPPETWMITA